MHLPDQSCTQLSHSISRGDRKGQPTTLLKIGPGCPQLDTTVNGGHLVAEYTGIRARPTQLFDVSFSKYFAIVESVKLQLRLDAFNVLNHQQFGTVPFEFDTGATDPNFGICSNLSGSNPPRHIELALKLLVPE